MPNTMKQEMVACNVALKDFKDWTAIIHLTSNWQAAYCGKAYSVVARMLVDQGVPEDLEGAKIEAGLFATAFEILALPDSCFEGSKPKNAENPWAAFAPKKKTCQAQSVELRGGLIEYDESGATGLEKRLLLAQGFVPEARVATKTGKANAGNQFVIKSIDDNGTVKLKPIDASGAACGQMVKAAHDIFINKYGIAHERTQKVVLDYPENDVAGTTRFAIFEAEADIAKALCEFYKSNEKPNVKIMDKPHKSVLAKSKCAIAKLNIPVFGKLICICVSASPRCTLMVIQLLHRVLMFSIPKTRTTQQRRSSGKAQKAHRTQKLPRASNSH